MKLDASDVRPLPSHAPRDGGSTSTDVPEEPVVDRRQVCGSVPAKASEHTLDLERGTLPVTPAPTQPGTQVLGQPSHRRGLVQLRALGQAGECAVRAFALESLTSGGPFRPELAQHIESLVGASVTAEGLLNAYRTALPGTHAILDTPQIGPSKITYKVRWLNNAGEELARLERDLIKDEDGSLELHRFGTWVDPSQRGRGLSAHIFKAETGLMKALSEHPRTRFTLIAGGSSKSQRSPEQIVGSYAWGNFGFDFAEHHGIRAFDGYEHIERCSGDAANTAHLSDLELLRTRFHRWVDKKVSSGELPNEPDFVAGLKDASALWDHPWEISHFDVRGVSLDVDLGGRKVPCHIGKAFLTSGDAAFWKGVFLVNSPKTSGPSRAGHRINASYVRETLSGAAANDAKRKAQLSSDITSGVPAKRLAAVEKIGVEGGPEWTTALQKAKERDPKLGLAVDEALRLIRGDGIIDANTRMAEDSDLELQRRVDAVERLHTSTGEWSLSLVRAFLQDDDIVTRQTGLTLLERGFSSSANDILLNEVATSFGHSTLLDEDDPDVRLQLVSMMARAGTSGVETMGLLLADEESYDVLDGALSALSAADPEKIDPEALRATRETIEQRVAALDGEEWD